MHTKHWIPVLAPVFSIRLLWFTAFGEFFRIWDPAQLTGCKLGGCLSTSPAAGARPKGGAVAAGAPKAPEGRDCQHSHGALSIKVSAD